MYIAVGIGLIVLILVLFLVNKFAPYSEFMSSFKKGTYKTLMTALSIAAVLSLTYGIYHAITYQPTFIDIQTEEGSRTIFGDIGDVGYYADGLVKKNETTHIRVVSWESLDIGEDMEVVITYPSGKEKKWLTSVNRLSNDTLKHLQSEYNIKGVYKLDAYTFEESGDVKLNIEDKKTITIDVKED